MIAELDFAPRIMGRAAKPLESCVGRDLTQADLHLLSTERGVRPNIIKELKDRHHALARAIASGMKDHEASAITGYSISRISILKADPSFAELLRFYRAEGTEVFADFVDRATLVSITAVNEIADRLEEAPEEFTVGQLLEVTKVTADRSGNAPVTRSLNTNMNVDLGKGLASARRRLAAVPNAPAAIPIIEGTFSEVES